MCTYGMFHAWKPRQALSFCLYLRECSVLHAHVMHLEGDWQVVAVSQHNHHGRLRYQLQQSLISRLQENPDDLIEKMQFQLFESLDVQGHFGMSQLKHIQRRFGKDADVMQVFMELVSMCALLYHSLLTSTDHLQSCLLSIQASWQIGHVTI